MAPDRGLSGAETGSTRGPKHGSMESTLAQTFMSNHPTIVVEGPSPPQNLANLVISQPKPSRDVSGPPTPAASAQTVSDTPKSRTQWDPFQFGQRYLGDADDVFQHNAWDHVTPDEAYLDYCTDQYEFQRAHPVSEFDKSRINSHPEKWWDTFYRHKSNTFFKDRKWLVQEFPILHELTRGGAGSKKVLEVGAGAGNTAFPILRMNENPELEVFAYDFSKTAVETMQAADDYEREGKLGSVRADIWDLASTANDGLPPGIESATIDVVILIFIFSALSPAQWSQAVRNVWNVLKPGGLVLFRDYGRGDLAQVRFKTGRYLDENFYVRGDGTRVYFFEKEEIERIWSDDDSNRATSSASTTSDHDEVQDSADVPTASEADRPRFVTLNLNVDRRLIVNRQRRIKMYRCWLQARFQKPDQG